jgi:CheY-like chemotaxis protein
MVSKILVIDDDPAVRGAFRLILEEDGFSVREAEDGLKGIERDGKRRSPRSDFS